MSVVAGALGGFAASRLTGFGAAFLAPTTRGIVYQANHFAPNVLLEVGAAIDLYWQNGIGWDGLLDLLQYHGVEANHDHDGAANPASIEIWQRFIMNQRGYADFGTLRKYWLLFDQPGFGPYGTAKLRQLLRQNKVVMREEQDAMLFDARLPGAETVLQLWKQGDLADAEADQWLRRLGWTHDFTRGMLFQVTSKVGVDTVLWMFNLGMLDEAAARAALKGIGYVDQGEQDRVLATAQQRPAPQQAIRWATAQAQDDQLAGRWGLDANFPGWMAEAWKAIGQWWGGDTNVVGPGGAPVPFLPLLDWRAHWFMPSPQQAMRLYQFVRPYNVDRWSVQRMPDGTRPFENLQPFSAQQLQDSLAASGIAPAAQLQMAASGFTPLSRRDLYNGIRFGLIPVERALNSYLDSGLDPADAALATQIQQARAQETLLKPFEAMLARLKSQYAKAWIDTYKKGGVSREEALSALSGLGYPLDLAAAILDLHAPTEHASFAARQTQRALAAGVRAALRLYRLGVAADGETLVTLEEMGIAPQAAALLVSDEKMAMRAQVAEAGIASVRRDFRAGLFSRSEAVDRLITFGILPQAASTYVAMWQAGQSDTRRRLQTGEIMRLVKEGLLSVADGRKRLQNLGWDKADLDLLAREMQYNVYKAGAATGKSAKAAAAAATAVGGTPPAPPPGAGGG